MIAQCVAILLPICILSTAQAQVADRFIDQAEQRNRDEDRRLILAAELDAERGALAKAQTALTAGVTNELAAQVHRHIENVKALQRELAFASTSRQAGKPGLQVVPKNKPKAMTDVSRAAQPDRTARFWDPYNRAPETTSTGHFDTRKEELP